MLSRPSCFRTTFSTFIVVDALTIEYINIYLTEEYLWVSRNGSRNVRPQSTMLPERQGINAMIQGDSDKFRELNDSEYSIVMPGPRKFAVIESYSASANPQRHSQAIITHINPESLEWREYKPAQSAYEWTLENPDELDDEPDDDANFYCSALSMDP
ncbi:hypothetical protein BGX27_009938 [Mortierella sp. AM989]|nr:hypothetical protein BGX27_009938 [Mortierella sp. AM989]